jgi:dTDP-4-dehydrorhamnose reductase
MLRLAAEREELSVVNDQRGTPTSADDLAAAIAAMLHRLWAAAGHDLWGTYHVTGGGETTWFGFAGEIFRLAAARGRKVPRLKAITTAEFNSPAPRPLYSVLDNSKVRSAFGIALPPWQESLAAFFEESRSPAPEGKVA